MQRPPHDKDYVQQCIKQLHKFLLSQGFPGTVTEKDIQSTTLEDLKKVTELIDALIHAELVIQLSFKIPTKKFDEETQKMLKDLGYFYDFSTASTLSEARVVLWLAWISDWILEWYSDKYLQMVYSLVSFPDVSDEPCDVEEGAEFNKPFTRHSCDAHCTYIEIAGVAEVKDEAFLNHLITVMCLAEALQKALENSCSSEAHKTAPENETAGQSEEQELVEVDFRQVLELHKRTANNERSKRECNEKIQKVKADIERLMREKDELLQTRQRLKQSNEEMEQKERNEKVTVSKTQKKKLRRRRRK